MNTCFSNGSDGLAVWAARIAIRNQDIVVWVNMGMHRGACRGSAGDATHLALFAAPAHFQSQPTIRSAEGF